MIYFLVNAYNHYTAVYWHTSLHIVIAFIYLLTIVFVITFMRDIYNYIPETNHVSRVYSVAAILFIQFVLHEMSFHP
jgi:hypothetical protein